MSLSVCFDVSFFALWWIDTLDLLYLRWNMLDSEEQKSSDGDGKEIY